ncbi:MAG: EsaB/YukD family protein [Lachnospiraceae bacterium]|nr:EsaB/YukD family protein [Lachnospiraceae bacterium]
MGGNGIDERCLTEIWVPQLSLSIDAKISKDVAIEDIGETVLKRFNADFSAFTVMSAVNERELHPEKTLAEEDIRRGDRLLILFE